MADGNGFDNEIFKEHITNEVKLFQQAIYEKYIIEFKVTIKSSSKYTKVLLLDSKPMDDDNWRAEFQFRTCGEKQQGIFLKFIRLPVRLQRIGLGTYSISWLEDLAKRYSFNYIVFSAYNSADGFWRKMGYHYSEDQLFVGTLYFGK